MTGNRHITPKAVSFMALAALLGLTGCSSNQVEGPVDSQDVAIAFSARMPEQEAVVRSTPLEDYHKNFRVWSYKNTELNGGNYEGSQVVMPFFLVNWLENTAGSTTSNSHDWEYVGQATDQTIKYWDFQAKAYRFFAVAPATASGTFAASAGGDSFGFTFTVDATDEASVAATPYFSELWFSNNNPTDYPDQAYGKQVTLKFMKPLARVRFMFVFNEGLDFGRSELTNIAFHPSDDTKKIATKGTVAITYPLTGTETTESVASAPTDGIAAFTTDEQWYYVLPGTGQDDYKLDLMLFSELKSAVVPAAYMTWDVGKEYTYIFKITDADRVVIDKVQVAISDWNEAGTVSHPIYNW